MQGSLTKIGIPAATTITSALLLMAPILAAAASPHFIGTPKIIKNSDFSLTASFQAAGLANVVTGAFLTASQVSADLQCVNPGGNNPPPKTATFGPATGPTTNIAPRNGQITATANLPPPTQQQLEDAADCPNPNWTVDTLSVTYTGVTLHIQQGGVDILTHSFGTIDT